MQLYKYYILNKNLKVSNLSLADKTVLLESCEDSIFTSIFAFIIVICLILSLIPKAGNIDLGDKSSK